MYKRSSFLFFWKIFTETLNHLTCHCGTICINDSEYFSIGWQILLKTHLMLFYKDNDLWILCLTVQDFYNYHIDLNGLCFKLSICIMNNWINNRFSFLQPLLVCQFLFWLLFCYSLRSFKFWHLLNSIEAIIHEKTIHKVWLVITNAK